MGQRSRLGKLAIIYRIHECVFERECEIEHLMIDICPLLEIDMEKQLNKVCGADIHKKFLVAAILSRDGTKITELFGMLLDVSRSSKVAAEPTKLLGCQFVGLGLLVKPS